MFSVRVILLALPSALFLLVACSSDSDGTGSSSNFFTDPPVIAAPPEPAETCFLAEEDVEVQSTEDSIDFVRTPDDCFDELDNFDYEPNYATVDGLRMHYVDEGPSDGEVILMLHGQPSWGYLYRKMIPPLVEAGFRVIVMDHIGMGRSDKPVEPTIHEYERHVRWVKDFIAEVDLSDITLFVQDWGSLIGLRVAGDMPDSFARIVVANGDMPVIPDGLNPFMLPSFEIDDTVPATAAEFFPTRTGARVESFQQWIDWAASVPNMVPADVIQLATSNDLTQAEQDSYNAPFPSQIYKAAVRAFPSMVAGIDSRNQPALEALSAFEKPFLFLAGEFDANLGSVATQQRWIDRVPGAAGQDHQRFMAGHFIQDDVGVELANAVIRFIEEADDNLSRSSRVGYEILNIISADEVIVWITPALTQEQFDAIELPAGWIKNQPRQAEPDGGGFTRSPSATMDGPLVSRLLFGHRWAHVATVIEQNFSVDDAGLLIGNVVHKFHSVNYNAGRTVFVLVSPEGEQYIRVSRDKGRMNETPTLPDGWQLQRLRTTAELMLPLPEETLVIRSDNEDSFQGPVAIPEESVELISITE